VASEPVVFPPNHEFVNERIVGVFDPDGENVAIKITGIFQDEPVLQHSSGSGNTCPDGKGVGTSFAQVRAERDGNSTGGGNGNKSGPGDGRVYHIDFTATDTAGDKCSGVVTVCVPHDMGNHAKGDWGRGGGGEGGGNKGHGKGGTCVDEGPLFDSTVCPASGTTHRVERK
jgi:hypothetical protein